MYKGVYVSVVILGIAMFASHETATSQALMMVLLLPTLSIVYAVVVAIFRYVWAEGTAYEGFGTLGRPLVVLGMALFVQSNNQENALSTEILSWAHGMLSLCSLYLLFAIHKYSVQGGNPPSNMKLPSFIKTIVITGSNTGIGYETAKLLWLHNHIDATITIILACRSLEKAEQAKQQLIQTATKTATRMDASRIHCVKCDLGSLQSVRDCATTIRDIATVDLLINNAGVMTKDYVITVDGYESVMQANHLGHYLLTRLLRPRRVVNLSSSTYTLAGNQHVSKDWMCQHSRHYSLFGQYAASKLANLYFTHELARRGYEAQAIHPGLVRTSVTRHMHMWLQVCNSLFAILLQLLQKTPEQGAWTTVAVACMTDYQHNGLYWVHQHPQALRPFATNPQAALELWNRSADWVGLPRDEESQNTNGYSKSTRNGHSSHGQQLKSQ